jgi:outer membrane protein assembly factor BamB
VEALRPADPRRIGGYQVLARLGTGGMGTVFLGRSAGGRDVAVKVVHAALAGDPEFRARFAREVAAARAVGGAFTAPVIDADPGAPAPWLVTAYLPGHSLERVVGLSGPLPPWSVCALGAGLAEALLSIHRAGVVHRDLKPSNVLLTPDGPRVIDFGVARAAELSAVTRTGATVGSPGYLSPEQAIGAESGPAGDVFSLGAVLTYAATGHGPFGHGTAPDLLYRVVHQPPWLDGVADPNLHGLITACLDKDPARRPAAEDVLHRLAASAPAPPYGVAWLPPPVAAHITAPVPLPATMPSRAGVGRRRVLIGAAGLAGAAALTGGALLLRDRTGSRDGAWTYRPESGELTGGPVLSGGLLFVTEDYQAHGMTALDPRTGERRWRTTDVRPPGAADPLRVIASGRVVYTNGGNQSFAAFDQVNGRSLWTVTADLITGDPAPVVAGGLLFSASTEAEQGLCAYDALTGQRRWVFDTGRPVRATPCVAGTTVYVANGEGTVFAVDAATGQTRWRQTLDPSARLPVSIGSPPLAAGGTLFVVTEDKTLYALGAADGRRRWKSTADSSGSSGGPAALSVSGDLIFLTDDLGGLYAIGTSDGTLRWRRVFSDRDHHAAALTPVVSGATAFCFNDHTLYALDRATGVDRWHASDLSATFEHPVLAAGAVHVASLPAVVSFDPATGRVLRRRPAEMAERLTASGANLYWRDGEKVYAATA